jgi:excisionase family DNA binding protein
MSAQHRPSTLAGTADLPATLDIQSAARLLGIGRTTAYALARREALPVPVIRVGSGYRVPTAPLLRLLGLEPPQPPTGHTPRPDDPHSG